MHVSELAKKLFGIMSKQGDIEVVGHVEVVNNRLILVAEEKGLDKEASEILPKLLTDEKGHTTATYL